jgi:hypothetical protein
MSRQFNLDLARAGLRMPMGTDLMLHEKPDPARIVRRPMGRDVASSVSLAHP